MKNEILLHTLSVGDEVLWKPSNQSIAVVFKAPRKVLSTSLLNGGYQEELAGVFNHSCGPDDGTPCKLRAAKYKEHLRLVAIGAGFDPDKATGMGTAALMEKVAIIKKDYRELVVTAIVTAGVEGNGGRVGDLAKHYEPIEKTGAHKMGTINIILIIDADMPPGTLARALVTCTEAKTAALQELMVGSLYSTGLATGSGTDQSIVIANPESSLYFEGAGKHNKLGELIGLAVKEAVTEALQKQNGLFPSKQHSVLRRLKRFGVNEKSLWQDYQAYIKKRNITEEAFLHNLWLWEREDQAVTYTSLYVHLLDQFQWGLLKPAEVGDCANAFLRFIGEKFAINVPQIEQVSLYQMVIAWNKIVLECLEKQFLKNTFSK